MTDYTVTETIRQSVSALQAAKALGLHPDRHGRCACPVHNGTDRNCCLDRSDRGFYCHVCHAGGDVIKLVRVVQNCSFQDALRWLDSAFHLGLPIDRPMDRKAQEAAEMARKRRETERAQREAIERMEFDLYAMASKLLNDLEADAETYRPTRPYREWDRRWAFAKAVLPEAHELVDELAARVFGKGT